MTKASKTNYEAADRLLRFEGVDRSAANFHTATVFALTGIGRALLAIADAIKAKQAGE